MGGGEAGVPDDLLTTKGDTHGYTTENARVPIGADTQVLTADSTQALGLGWAATAGLGANVFTGSQTIPPDILKSQGTPGLGGLTFEPTASNTTGHLIINPSGTANRSQLSITRQSDPTTNLDALVIGGDIVGTSEMGIRTFSSGTGTTRNLHFYYDATKIASLVSDGFGVVATKKLYFDGGGDTYISEAGANYVDLICGSNRVFRGNASMFEYRSSSGSGHVAGNWNDGYGGIRKNTADGKVYLDYNDGGTLKSVELT
jgi:hypothetical protein